MRRRTLAGMTSAVVLLAAAVALAQQGEGIRDEPEPFRPEPRSQPEPRSRVVVREVRVIRDAPIEQVVMQDEPTDDFIRAGGYFINRGRIDYAEPADDEGLRVYIRGRDEPISLTGAAAEEFRAVIGVREVVIEREVEREVIPGPRRPGR